MKKKVLGISCLFLLTLGFLLILHFQEARDSNLVGTYINGEYSNTIPSKNDGYIIEKIVCDNETVGVWDEENWGLQVTNLTKKSKCNVYFRTNQVNNIIKELDTSGKCPSVNSDGSVNVTSAESENSLLCSAPDNYGTSYYYRGNVQNNYVKFANFYWRIVRINGDGTVRVIYDGTVAHANGTANLDGGTGTVAFNDETNDNAYVGYMYGNIGSSTYAETHANINDSTIKKHIDNWYETNILNTDFEQYIVDNTFCNDRSFSNDNPGTGFGDSPTFYRWTAWNSSELLLYCNQKNDSFTSRDLVNGNGKLKYPIALLSLDEVLLAGGWQNNNDTFYLNIGTYYWTMTPAAFFADKKAYIRDVFYTGMADRNNFTNNYELARPVINLKPQAIMYGNGEMNNPYRLTSEIK